MVFPDKDKKRKDFASGPDQSEGSGSNAISVISQDLLSYLLHIADSTSDSDFSADDLARRCMEEISGSESDLVFHNIASRHLERIFGQTPSTSILFLHKLQTLKRKLLIDISRSRFGSRVLEALFHALVPVLENENDQFLLETTDILTEWTTLFCEEWNDLSADRFANHVIRCLGRVFCGLEKEKEGVKTRKMTKSPNANMLPESLSNFKMLVSRALDWKLMKDWFSDSNVSCLIQDYITFDVVAKTNYLSTIFIQGCLDEASESDANIDSILSTWQNPNTSRIWDSVFENASTDDLERIVQILCQNNLAQLACAKSGNFPIQRLLNRCQNASEELVADVLSELLPEIAQIMKKRFFGVILAIAKVCKGNDTRQHDFVKELSKALDWKKKKNSDMRSFLRAVLILKHNPETDIEENFSSVTSVHMQGSLLIQELLLFNPPIKRLIQGFISLNQDQSVTLCCHQFGSHTVDKFFTSEFIEQQMKEELLEKITGQWTTLVANKYGSRVFDTIWRQIQMKEKCEIAQELSDNSIELKRSNIGQLMFKKYELELFKTSIKKWRQDRSSKEKHVKLFKL